jgi:hypothetical protein
MNTFDVQYHSIVAAPSMVVGFISTELHEQLRRMAAERACSESSLVSEIVRNALEATPKIARERQ